MLDHRPAKPASYVRILLVAASIIVGLWFLYETLSIIFFFFFAVVLTLILNAPAMWLISKKIPRPLAAILIFLLMLLFLFLISWLVIPRIMEQITGIIGEIPGYLASLKDKAARLLEDYPSLREKILGSESLEEHLPSATRVVTSVGRFSFSLIGGLFLLIVFLSIVLYMLINPAPLLETYLLFFTEEKRQKAAHALARASNMVVGWMWSNLVVGSIEAVCVFFFLKFMGVPGVWVWAGLALFAEMVPRLGLYIMAIPPVLIALSIDSGTALWVLAFYLALNEIMGDFVSPRIRARTMNLHPVSTLFVMLAMAGAFGLMGALIATPLTAFIKAYYETFYLSGKSKEGISEQVRLILTRDVEPETEE